MATIRTRRWLIAERPHGREIRSSDFRLDEADAGVPGAGQVLLRTLYLGFDPSQKGVMENLASYAAPVEIGSVMPGQGVAEVVESRAAALPAGSLVSGPVGWSEYAVVDAAQLQQLPEGLPLTAALGVLGTTGMTAYLGLFHVGAPRPGDVVVVSGAAGAVGSVVGQLAKIAGCTAIGIAGGADKCATLMRELGFDAAIDYKTEKVRSRLRELSPNGIDVFFDNVGGPILNDALARLAPGARVVICGAISRYNDDPRSAAQTGPANYFNVVATNATIQGFLMMHYERYYAGARRRLAAWARDGRLKQQQDIVEGFENAPQALMRLFTGANLGKQLLKVTSAGGDTR